MSGPDSAKARALKALRADEAARRRRRSQAAFAKQNAPGRETGTELAIARETVEVVSDALIPEDPQDKTSPVRRGPRAQRVWAPDRLIRGASPALEQHQHDAATRFYDDYVIGELGARVGPRSPVRADPWSSIPFDETRVVRRESYRAAMRTLGPLQFHLMTWCVLQETPQPDLAPTIEKWAEHIGWKSTERATGFFAATLEGLAQHYGFVRVRDPSALDIPSRYL